jgi:4'-phosphopantetheinyl transferase EntD
MFTDLFPPPLCSVLLSGAVTSTPPLEELACIAEAHDNSYRESFLRGRAAARSALFQLTQHPPQPLVRAPGTRHPLWPDGICGSISHTADKALCVVAYRTDLRSIGIDIEESSRDAYKLLTKIALPEERAWIEAASNKHRAAITLFSLKESIYKAINPVDSYPLGFFDVAVMPQESSFTNFTCRAQPMPPASIANLCNSLSLGVRYSDTLVITRALLPC